MALRSSVRAFTLGVTAGAVVVGAYLRQDLQAADAAVLATIKETSGELRAEDAERGRELSALHDAFVAVPPFPDK